MFRSTEQQHFSQLLDKHFQSPKAPLLLEGGVGLGKTRAYLASIAKTQQRVALVLPTHQLIDQLLASKDLAAVGLEIAVFRPHKEPQSRVDYLAQREHARAARVMLCTAASVVIDQRLRGEYNGATKRDVLVFDEADQLPDMAALQSDFVIDASLLQDQPLRPALERISSTKSHTVQAEQKAAARVMLEILDEPVAYASVGLDDAGNARLHHRLPGRLLKKLGNRPSSVFISATLSHADKFDNFRHAMGIGDISPLSTSIEPVQHGTLDFAIHPHEVETDAWFAAVVQGIQTAQRPTLVVTPSHALDERLKAVLGDQQELLIKAGIWAGLDTRTRWRTVVIPRVPFGAPVVVNGEAVTSYLDAKVTATRRMRQAIGRGLRTPDALCTVLVYDARVATLGNFVPKRFAKLWELAERAVFDEGKRQELVLSKAERDPGLRKAALKRYGAKCQHTGCEENNVVCLEVHHRNPIAEGVRKTTLEDVMVLCANHHRVVHSEMREQKLQATPS